MINLPLIQTTTHRIITYRTISAKLDSLNNPHLSELIEKAEPVHSGMGGNSVLLKIDGVNIFVKKIPLTDIEREPENILSTANLFQLPLYYQYGIGSAGFGAWRELSAHIMATHWVLKDECQSFPLMYHWRILPSSMTKRLPEGYYLRLMYEYPTASSLSRIKQGELGVFCEDDKLYCKVLNKEKMQIVRTDQTTVQGIDTGVFDRIIRIIKGRQRRKDPSNCESMREEDKVALFQFASLLGYIPSKLDRLAERWSGSSSIRARLEAITKASADLVLCLEYIPETLGKWLEKQLAKGGSIADSAIEMVERELKPVISFIGIRGLLHFDAHFSNILTDGFQLYLTDFGLATSTSFKLSEDEINFIKTHRGFDQSYIMGLWTDSLATILFGRKDFKAKLHQYVSGKGEELTSSLATRILTRDAQNWIMMDAFFKRLKKEIRSGKILSSKPGHINFPISKEIMLYTPLLSRDLI